ncbi:CAP domain-containing protein [Desulfatitalea alkaliphila]|uniref:CAP domain-containing protein n=1 Tax=Desulfatitalea alkaliphila TaxID=2929485 RepID=A0AA41URJ8_9BACT|nr:CAP domain-containing protein [Desulfatitalea alkaliphila]MCJ8502423.1 CAP domain-containing protein [Desulfatitalea alkaliphila]
MPLLMPWYRRLCLPLLLALLWGVAGPDRSGLANHSAAPLLREAPRGQVNALPINPDVVLRQRTVWLDAQLFASAVPERIRLDLFEDRQYVATMLWNESGDDGGLTWFGRIEGDPESRVTLVVHGPNASAMIRVDGRRFDLRPLTDALHVVQEMDGAIQPTAPCPDPLNSFQDPAMETPDRHFSARSAMNGEEQAVLDLVNQERSKHDRLPLAADDRLAASARAHSRDMSDNNYFSHTSQDGRTAGQRITAAGYAWSTYGENIAKGYRTPETVVLAWMNSTGHRQNILNQHFCDLGVGYVASGYYWTQNFGRLNTVSQCPAMNRNPRADFAADPSTGAAPLIVHLNAGASNDPDGDPLTYEWTLGFDQNAEGITLQHTFSAAGYYAVTLTVRDDSGGADSATRWITVTAPDNAPPIANDIFYDCDAGGQLHVPAPGVLENDDDLDNPYALAVALVTPPEHGTLALDPTGAFTYLPAAGFTGEDHFTYTAFDGEYQSAPATVTIVVRSTPSAAQGDSGGSSGGCFVESLSRCGAPSGHQ